jgi:hypothetical protein
MLQKVMEFLARHASIVVLRLFLYKHILGHVVPPSGNNLVAEGLMLGDPI